MGKKDQKVYMPLMVGDWLKGTRGMRAEMRGVYLNLLLYQWDNGFLPADMEELILIDPEVVKVWDKLKHKFVEVEPGKLKNEKNQQVRDFFSKQQSNGQLGGRPKKEENPKPNPNANPKPNLHNDIDIEHDIDNVIELLNSTVGTNFKKSTERYREHIRARMRDGYNEVDFKAVIESRFEAWGQDSHMVQFLRPQTLFGTKFDGYLQASKIKTTSKFTKALSINDKLKQEIRDKYANSTGEQGDTGIAS